MPIDTPSNDQAFLEQIELIVGRPLDAHETRLALSLQHEKSVEIIAREMDGAVIADPKKIRPEHSDTANE